MQTLIEDFRFALRMLSRQKVLTAVAVITLALGMGMNTAIFSTVSGILWHTLPYPEPQEMVSVWADNQKQHFNHVPLSYREVEEWRAARSLRSLAAYRFTQVGLRGAGDPQSIVVVESGQGLFDVLGQTAVMGRLFTPEEQQPGDHRVAVITDALWRREFGGEAGVLGKQIRIDGRIHTVIGVLPPDFSFLYSKTDVFLPLQLTDEQRNRRDFRVLRAIGRLNPGYSAAAADQELRGISARVDEAEPQAIGGWVAVVRPLELDVIDKGARTSIQTMFWAVIGVLLIACTNISSLLLARGALRQRELAIRASLGAGQARLVRFLVTESVVLCTLGGVLGTFFARFALPVIRNLAPKDFPRLEYVQLDSFALLYTFLLCLVCGLIAGAAPAWLLTRGELARTLHEGGRGGTFSRQRFLQSLVITEFALAMVLLTITGLLVRSLSAQLNGDTGFDRSRLLIATLSLPASEYPERQQQARFYQAVAEGLRRDARIQHASGVQSVPLAGSSSFTPIGIEGQPQLASDRKLAGIMVVLPGYFATLGVPLLSGRDFTVADDDSAPKVAIINETMAKRYWPGDASPLGRRFQLTGVREPKWITVVGLSRDVRHQGPTKPARPEMYLPVAQTTNRSLVLMARTKADPLQAAAAMQAAVWAVDRNQAITQMETMDSLVDRRLAGPRVTVQILGFLAVLALLLSALGIYGVLSYLTNQRAKEIGIRVALGAVPRQVVQLVLRRGFLLAGAGLVIGCAGAAALTPLVRSLLDGVQPHDARSFSVAAAALVVAAIGASAFPVLRALKLDPVRVLRDE
jgi:putative ABC transport system permease protein